MEYIHVKMSIAKRFDISDIGTVTATGFINFGAY